MPIISTSFIHILGVYYFISLHTQSGNTQIPVVKNSSDFI